MFISNKIESSRLGVKEDPYWEFIAVGHYISPILHNQINLGHDVLYNLLYYSNDKIEKNILKKKSFVIHYML